LTARGPARARAIHRLVEEMRAESGLPMDGIQEVLEFWFGDDARTSWFHSSPAFDQTIRQRFGGLCARAATGELAAWEASAEGCLALCILLDQMPRNMFRGAPRAFATDDRALAVAEQALAQGFDRQLSREQKQFVYLPFMHSEDLANQLRALALFESGGMTENRRFAERHVAIIRRFGRFPHRNAIVGRPNTEAEAEYLSEVGERYGQAVPSPEAQGLR
jgi:uncharacterized protein (DUF924 family)